MSALKFIFGSSLFLNEFFNGDTEFFVNQEGEQRSDRPGKQVEGDDGKGNHGGDVFNPGVDRRAGRDNVLPIHSIELDKQGEGQVDIAKDRNHHADERTQSQTDDCAFFCPVPAVVEQGGEYIGQT